MGYLRKYMNEQLVAFLDVDTRDEAIAALIDTLDKADYLPNPEEFHQAVLAREKIVSTGIGMNVAVPHAKLPQNQNFFIMIGILKKGIEWGAIDGHPVRLVFMIGGPDDKQTEYLQILSQLTVIIKDEEKRKKLLSTQDAEVILSLF
jgi:PTS system nitrogen regulatory IIA component